MDKATKTSKPGSRKSSQTDLAPTIDTINSANDTSSETSSLKPASFLTSGSSTKPHFGTGLFVPGNLELIKSGISLNATSPEPDRPPELSDHHSPNPPELSKSQQSNPSSLASSRVQSQHGILHSKSMRTCYLAEEHHASSESQRGFYSVQGSDNSVSLRYTPGKDIDPITHDGWKGPPYEKNTIVQRAKGRRTVYLFKESDVILFDKVARWKKLHPSKSMGEAWDELASHTMNGRLTPVDGIIQFIYGVKRYDYILKFKLTPEAAGENFREAFEGKLLKKGLLVERETSFEDASEVFVKILCPFHVLCTEAQLMKLKMPLKIDEAYLNKIQKVTSQSRSSIEKKHPVLSFIWSYLKPVFEDDLRLDMQAAIFNRNKLQNFEEIVIGHFCHNVVLNPGVRYLLSEGIYTAMFHLHDDLDDLGSTDNLRLDLKREWAQRYFSYQPLDKISAYFGEKVALYFAFNGEARRLESFQGFFSNTLYRGASFRWAVLFDNTLTPWYGIFNSLWAMLMPSVWNRQANYLSWKWSTHDFEKEESKRPEFKPTGTRRSEVTGKNELYFPPLKRHGRQVVSSIIICIWVAIMAVFISLQISLGAYVSPSPVYYSIVKPAFLSQNLFGLKYLNDSFVDRFQEICIPWIAASFAKLKAGIKNRIRNAEKRQRKRAVAASVTEEKAFDQSPEPKPMALSVSTLGDLEVTGRPSLQQRAKPKETSSGGSFLFGTSLKNMAAMVVESVAGGATMGNDSCAALDDRPSRLPQYYRDDKLPEYTGVRDEYAQKVVQFGFVAMFVSINPLAPFFALLNNTYEIRADAYKVLIMNQRPIPVRAQDIGSWEAILRFTARMSVATNSVQIAFTSAAFYSAFLAPLPTVGSRMAVRVGFIILFHYAVYSITAILQWLIPEIPSSVQLAMARTNYLDRLESEQDVEGEDEFLSNPSLYSERNMSSDRRFESTATTQKEDPRFFSVP
ncbi:Anoctamin-7 [Dinochytrium kinnereticum]|nr:Anoctamin-7 [Dinochytrium kinnereticum]